MNVQKRNDVTIYNLSSGPTLPEWLGERARRNLSKRDENVRRRIELLQDFQMPSSSSKIVASPDGRYIMVGGTYPPRIRCYDLHELTMKFERYVDGHIVDLALLGEDYGKLAILQDDRTIAFHAHYGKHESIRIPKFGRGMAYESTNCELLIASSGSEVYRLNLEEGRFMEPWSIDAPTGVATSCISVSQAQPLATVGCDDGMVRFFDNRSPDALLKPFLKLDVQSATEGYGFADPNHFHHQNVHEITSLGHDTSGLYMAAGTAGGLVALYDVRSSKPLHVCEHKQGTRIHTIRFHSGSGCVFSSDEKLVKLWKYKTTGDLVNSSSAVGMSSSSSMDRFENLGDGGSTGGKTQSVGAVVANIEGSGKFTNFILAGDEKDPSGNRSGLLLCATDQPKLEAYYVPKVGLAPTWCSFLENVTEELEERDLKRETTGGSSDLVRDGQETVFENYKFVSREDLEKLGVSDLIGTPLLKAYMHGFFMDINLYNKVRAVANPFEYEEYRKKKVKERLEAKRASRIAPKESSNAKKAAAVNPELADRLQLKADRNTKSGKVAQVLLADNRFGNLFSNPDFEIDEDDENFKFRNPSGVAAVAAKRKRKDDMDSDAEENYDDDDNDYFDESATGVTHSQGEAAGFRRVYDEDDHNDEEEEESHYDSGNSDSDEDGDDGFRGGKVRGEAYDEVKQIMRGGNKKSQKAKPLKKTDRPKKSNKAVMYEADDLGETNNMAVHAGMGESSATQKVKDKIRRMNMPLEKRFGIEDKEEPYVKVTNKGGSKEIHYVPKDSRKKPKNLNEEDDDGGQGYSRRNRRGVKDLRLKKPFKTK